MDTTSQITRLRPETARATARRYEGHDHHFLSRLDRVDLRHAEMALELYRDHQLVREILRASSAPCDAPRIAISLDDPKSGPFVIVAKDGHFVTCLAEGMRVNLPVVDREELDLIASHLNGLRNAAHAVAQDPSRGDVLRRVLTRGEFLYAEDLAELRPVLPLIEGPVTIRTLVLGESIVSLLPAVRRVLGFKGARARSALAEYAKALYRYRNHMLIAGLASPRLLREIIRQSPECSLSRPAHALGLILPVVTGGWLMAQFGPDAIEAIAKRVDARDGYGTTDAVAGLCAIAARYPAYRADIRDVLSRIRVPPSCYERHPAAASGLEVLRMDAEGSLAPAVHAAAQAHAFKVARVFFPDARGPADIPAGEALTLYLQNASSVTESGGNFLSCLMLVHEAAKLDAEALCLPRRFKDLHRSRLDPQLAPTLIQGIRQARPLPQPERAPQRPGRNEACPCESGRKYKRCCIGLRAAA
jgi:hypothetical protein